MAKPKVKDTKEYNTEAYRSGHNEAVLKTVWVQAHGGSNPSASATAKVTPVRGVTFYCVEASDKNSPCR